MRFALLPVLAYVLLAQTPDSQVVFEVATVKHGPPGDYSVSVRGGPGTSDPVRYTIENCPLACLVEIAYRINSYQLSGPGWLDDERFTVTANVPQGATIEQLPLMMRNLLIERFKLAAHFEKKQVAGYQLVVAKAGPKFTPSLGEVTDGENAAKSFKWGADKVDKDGYPELPPGRHYAMSIANGRARWRFGDESMDAFSDMLANQLRQPIANSTGLTEKYDFVMFWDYAAMGPDARRNPGPSIFAALQEQLGLKLESKKVPVDMVVIDHIERTPTEN